MIPVGHDGAGYDQGIETLNELRLADISAFVGNIQAVSVQPGDGIRAIRACVAGGRDLFRIAGRDSRGRCDLSDPDNPGDVAHRRDGRFGILADVFDRRNVPRDYGHADSHHLRCRRTSFRNGKGLYDWRFQTGPRKLARSRLGVRNLAASTCCRLLGRGDADRFVMRCDVLGGHAQTEMNSDVHRKSFFRNYDSAILR